MTTETVVAPPDPRDAWISDYVPGNSFADIGGLLYTIKERVTYAANSGASETTMIDLTPDHSDLWEKFRARCRESGVTNYSTRIADVMSDYPEKDMGTYDFVHCSGVIYHVADLFRFMRNLHRVTNKFLIMTSMVIPNEIENEFGQLIVDEPICVPLLTEQKRNILGGYFKTMALPIPNINGKEMPWLQPDVSTNYTPWWWLLTADLMVKRVELYGFEVMDTGNPWVGRSSAVFCRKK